MSKFKDYTTMQEIKKRYVVVSDSATKQICVIHSSWLDYYEGQFRYHNKVTKKMLLDETPATETWPLYDLYCIYSQTGEYRDCCIRYYL
jgi:hypothetical protein